MGDTDRIDLTARLRLVDSLLTAATDILSSLQRSAPDRPQLVVHLGEHALQRGHDVRGRGEQGVDEPQPARQV